MHVTSLHPAVVELSSNDDAAVSSDENEDFSSTFLSPGFHAAAMPTHGNMLVPLDPAGQQMIGQYIFFKWPTCG